MSKYDKDTKFYWLQLKEDFFENDAIEWLEEQKPNGRDYAYFYLKLCLKSLKTNGILIRKVGNILIPYDNQKLAELTRIDFDTVTVAMELLKKIGLITILESGEIYVNQLENLIGSKSVGAFKKQQQRTLENKGVEQGGGHLSTQCPPKCPPKIEIELELEKEIEIESELEKEKKSASFNTFDYFENNIGLLTGISLEMLTQFQEELPNELIKYAIDKAVLNNARTPNYVFSILNDWVNKGIKNMLMVKEEEQKFKQSATNNQVEEVDYFGRPIKRSG